MIPFKLFFRPGSPGAFFVVQKDEVGFLLTVIGLSRGLLAHSPQQSQDLD